MPDLKVIGEAGEKPIAPISSKAFALERFVLGSAFELGIFMFNYGGG